MEAWSRTTNDAKAAALGTLGIPLQFDKTVDAQSGRGWQTILIGHETMPTAKDLGGRVVEGKDDEEEAPSPARIQTKMILTLLAKGELHKADPHHPLIDMLGVCAARDTLLHWLKSGAAHRLERIRGARRTALVPGEEIEAVKALGAFRTRDIRLAAALTRLGGQICRIEPAPADKDGKPRDAFVFPLQGMALDEPPMIIPDLVNAYRGNTLPQQSPNHPLLWMMQCLINQDCIRDSMNRQKEVILIRAPGTGRASLIHRDSTPQCLDLVRKRLGITF